MRKTAILMGLLIAVSGGFVGNVQAVERSWSAVTDSLKGLNDHVAAEKKNVSSVTALHEWFDEQSLKLSRDNYGAGQGFRVVPLGIYKTKRVFARQDTAKWNIGAEYHLPLNTMNGSFTVFSHRFGSTEAYAKLFFGFGMGPISGLDDTLDTEASNYGVNGELAFNTKDNWFNPLVGLSYVWVSPDKGVDGQGNYLYGGNRFFIASRILSIDLRAGTAFWRGLDDNVPPGWFVSGGLTLHSLVNVTKAGKPLFAPIEVGLFGNLSLETLGAKFMFPLRLRKGVTLAPFMAYNREFGVFPYSAVYGLGAEIRLFGDVSISPLNPYVGVQQYWLDTSPDAETGTSVYYGTRFYVSDLVAIDANFGPVFWRHDAGERLDLKDWIGRVGITVAFGKIREKMLARGAIMTRRADWGTSKIDEGSFNRLTQDDLQTHDGEVRVYALEERGFADSTRVADTVVISDIAMNVGNLTDIKFFKIDLDFGMGLDPISRKAGLLDESESNKDKIFIAVLFDKTATLDKSLKENNTFFHFIDLDKGQYFGYRWELDRTRQPEHRADGILGKAIDTTDQPYMGAYNEFVQPMSWLDQEMIMGFIKGSAVEQEILRVMSIQAPGDKFHWQDAKKYRLGYVSYRRSTLGKLKRYLKNSNLGVAVMVGRDQNRDLLDSLAMVEGSVPANTFKLKGDFYFSNLVKMEDIFEGEVFPADRVTIDGFRECSAMLSAQHKSILDNEVLSRLRDDPQITVTITGYTDATPMIDSCRMVYPGDGGQKELAIARAQSVADYLTHNGIQTGRFTVDGLGIKQPPRKYAPADRSVVIKFSD